MQNQTKVVPLVGNRDYLIQLLYNTNNHTIIKFTAKWCKPCKQIAEYCRLASLQIPQNIDFYEFDVDESDDLYAYMRKMKMVNGIPVLLFYSKENKSYISDVSVTGANIRDLDTFFHTITAFAVKNK